MSGDASSGQFANEQIPMKTTSSVPRMASLIEVVYEIKYESTVLDDVILDKKKHSN